MKRILSYVLVFGMFCTLMLTGCEPAEEVEGDEETLKFAAVGALSGAIADWGIPIQEALFYWRDDVNERGGLEVGGTTYKVEVVSYDDQGDNEVMLEIFNRLIYQEGVNYILPLFMGSTAYAALDIVDNNEVFIMTAAYGYDDVLGVDHPTWFRNYVNPQERNPATLRWIRDNYPETRRWVDIVSDDPAGIAIDAIHKKYGPMYGFDMIGIEFLDQTTADFLPVMSRVVDMKPDVINLGNVDLGIQPLLIKAARELGYKGLMCTDCNGIVPDVFVPAAGGPQNTVGFICSILVPYGEGEKYTPPEYVAFMERYEKDHGFFSDWAADNYVSLQVIEQAILRADSIDVLDVAAEIEGSTFETIVGTVRFVGDETYGRSGQMLPPLPIAVFTEDGTLETVDVIVID